MTPEEASRPIPKDKMQISISTIFIPPDRQRSKVNESAIAELAISLATHGQLHAITVAPIDRVRFPDAPSTCQWVLVAGYRRLLATALNKYRTIEANLKEGLDEFQLKEIELDENLRRESLPWQDEVKAKAALAEIRAKLYGDSVRDVAAHIGEAKTQTWEDVKLAKAIQDNPELANAKNKTQAQNKLRLLTRREALTEKAAERQLQGESAAASNVAGKVKLGDCLVISKEWASGIIDCVVTDPPYGINLDQGETKKGSAHPVIYDDDTYDIMDLTARVAAEAFRLLRDNTHAYFFFDIKAYAKVYRALTDVGFTVDPIPLLWVKPGPGQVNHPDSRWGSGYEACFFCRKGQRALLKQGQSNVLAHDPVPSGKKIHPVEKPVSLLRQLIESSTAPGEVVLDFFGGSGSTGEAALQTGRNFLLCEKDPAYHQGIVDRLEAVVTGVKPTRSTSDDDDEDADWEEARARNKRKN